ncbi:MAG: hypothetical protein ACE5H9_17310 [Anaerolineae bacterium]
MERINYKGWPNCYRLSNGLVDVVVTTDVGPRVTRFGFVGQENEFKEYEEMVGKIGGDEWRIYGGHRLWHAPEDITRTYFPDNGPVTLKEHNEFIRLIQPPEATTGIQKEIDLRLAVDTACVTVTHRLRNVNLWPVELAPWALSVMAENGKAIIPLPPRGSHPDNLRPYGTLTLWAYTNLADRRWTWGNQYVLLQQSPQMTEPQKIGLPVPAGWVAYARHNHLFVKKFNHIQEATYPDYGCSVEVFTDGDMLEVETLGPLVSLQPQAIVEHTERWFLFDGVPTPQNDDEVNRYVLPRIQKDEG